MTQYNKLFDKSEIEYITPFLKLWMAFNNWYKEDLPEINFDSEAIKHYKEKGKIKDEFLKYFSDTSDVGIEFNIALYELVLNIKNYRLKNKNGGLVRYNNSLILENADSRGGKEPIFISETKRRFQIDRQDKEIFFKNTLEIIYQVRCNLVHGSFDIENLYFIKLVENSYKILYPIMNRILQMQADGEFICISIRKNVEARGVFNAGEMVILAGSKVTKDVVNSYDKKEERNKILNENAYEESNYFKIKSNIEFKSPSAASSFCLGNSSSGWEDWKSKSGKTMNEVLRNSQT